MQRLVDLWYQRSFRSVLYQGLFLIILLWCLSSFWHVLQNNLDERGITLGFDFLQDTAGFNIIQRLIAYDEQSNYFQVFVVGLLNTLLVSVLGIIFATLIGFLIGIARVSSFGLIRGLATLFIESIRNVPLLLQLFVWYFVVLRAAPYPQQAINFFNSIYISNRGIYLPSPEIGNQALFYIFVLLLALCSSFICLRCNKNTCLLKGKRRSLFFLLGVFSALSALIALILLVTSVKWQIPVLGRFNFEQGFNLLPEFLALLIALSIYTAAYIAEVVRMGIRSVPKAQWEAALSLGFSSWQTLRLIIIPQSLKVILPPLTNQYLNLIKNSSLAAAIAYPDLVSIFAGTALNQTGHAVEIIAITMGVYLLMSLIISVLMLKFERATKWGQRL